MDGVNQNDSVNAETAGSPMRSQGVRPESRESVVPGGRHRSPAAVAVAALAAVTLAACAGGEGGSDGATGGVVLGGTTPGTETSTAGPEASGAGVSGAVGSLVAVATAAGWTCIPGADPFTGKPGATCSPGAEDVMTSAVFAVFDRVDVSDGAEAVRLAKDATVGQVGDAGGMEGAQEGTVGEVLPDQYLPLDSQQLSGYCVNTLGTCAGTDFTGLGLVLGR